MSGAQGYTVWQAAVAAIKLSLRAIEEVRALARVPGPAGEQGERGAPGKLSRCDPWEDRVYYEGDLAEHRGSTYQADRDTAKEPPHEDWSCVARAGSDGRSITIRGTYSTSPDEPYRKNDVVALNGGSFVARRDLPGDCPGDGWQLIASQGRRGDKGVTGDKGPKGDQGKEGPTIVGWRDDVKNYAATPVMSDGTEGPALNIRVYLEQFLAETER